MSAAVLPQAVSLNGQPALAAAAARGDTAAFRQLYEQHGRTVYNLVLRSVRNAQLAEDLCQEVWVKAYRELPKLRDPSAFSAWLYRIAGRACVDAARRRSSGATTVELHDHWPASAGADPEDATLQRERDRLAWESLGALPERQHLALFLREVEDRSYQEIAEVMQTTESAVETLLFRARRAFADAFERLDSANAERCGQARTVMSALIDGEATSVQRRAVGAHVDGCRPCRIELQRLQGASAAYAGLPLLPVPALLGERVFELIGFGVVGGSVGGGAGAGGLPKLAGLLAAKTKLAMTVLTLTGALTTATLLSPFDSSPAAHLSIGANGMPAAAQDASGQRTLPIAPADASEQPLGSPSTPGDQSDAAVTGTGDTLGDVGQLTEGLPALGPTLDGVTDTAETLVEPVHGVTQDVVDTAGDVVDTGTGVVDEAAQDAGLPLDSSSVPDTHGLTDGTLPGLP